MIVRFKLSDLPVNQWLAITITNLYEAEMYRLNTPNAPGYYTKFKAYFDFGKIGKRYFELVLPTYAFKGCLSRLPRSLLKDAEGREVSFNLMKLPHGKLEISDFRIRN
jgi:hypothetical protein